MSFRLPTHLSSLTLLLPIVLGACAGPEARTAVAPVEPRTVEGVAPRYQPMFQALKGALSEREDDVARRIAANLRLRLERDRALGVRGATRNCLELLDAFDRVLHGRALVDGLDLELVTRPVTGQNALALVLRARTRGATPVELRPGAALLRIHRITLSPEGKESRAVSTRGVEDLERLVLDGGDWLEVPLGTFSSTLPSNALGARTSWTLELRAGDILDQESFYPAQEVRVDAAERVDLAAFLPNTPVEPSVLASFVERPEVALAPILERTVRIAPSKREDALDLLAAVVERMSAEQIARLVPSLRWLSRTNAPGRDPLAWRSWLRQRSEYR
jgi:hypothetical protein